jgi:hypothetical protein
LRLGLGEDQHGHDDLAAALRNTLHAAGFAEQEVAARVDGFALLGALGFAAATGFGPSVDAANERCWDVAERIELDLPAGHHAITAWQHTSKPQRALETLFVARATVNPGQQKLLTGDRLPARHVFDEDAGAELVAGGGLDGQAVERPGGRPVERLLHRVGHLFAGDQLGGAGERGGGG